MMVEKRFNKSMAAKSLGISLILISAAFIPSPVVAQDSTSIVRKITLSQAITEATEKNLEVKAGIYHIDYQKALQGTALELPKTDLSWMGGQYNSTRFDNNLTVTQSLPHPSVGKKRRELLSEQVGSVQTLLEITKASLIKQVKSVWYSLEIVHKKQDLLKQESIRAENFVKAAELRYKTGEANQLEYSIAQSEQGELQTRIIRAQGERLILQRELQTLLNSAVAVEPVEGTLTRRDFTNVILDTSGITANPYFTYLRQQILIEKKSTAVQRTSLLPGFSVGYFNQSLIGNQLINGNEVFFGAGKRFQGVQLGMTIPVFNGASKARIRASELNEKIAQNQFDITQIQLISKLRQALQAFETASQSLKLYEQKTLTLSAKIGDNATKAYKAGEIGYVEYGQALTKSLNIRFIYLDLLDSYNQSVIEIEYLLDKRD